MEEKPPTAQDLKRAPVTDILERKRQARKAAVDALFPRGSQEFLLALADVLDGTTTDAELQDPKNLAAHASRGAARRLRVLVENARRFERGAFTGSPEQKL